MADALLTNTDGAQQPSASLLGPEPRRSAPPVMQQAVRSARDEEVVWDESLMDVDDDDVKPPVQGLLPTEPGLPELQLSDVGLAFAFLSLNRRQVSNAPRSRSSPRTR